MKKTVLTAVLVALVAVVVPAFAAADPGSAVQADLAQLSSDIKTAHDTLIADFGAVTTAAQSGDKAAVRAAVLKARADGSSLLPAVQKDRAQLRTDLQAARAAHVTGLALTVRTAVQANQALIKEIRQARRTALGAVKSLRGSKN